MTNIIKIVAAVVDTTQVTFYKQDGSTLNMLQGDPRLATIIRQITPVCARGEVAEVDLDFFAYDTAKIFTDYEYRSAGVVKFFRVAKNKLASFFSSVVELVEPTVIGLVDTTTLVPTPAAPKAITQIASAIEEIMAHAKPVSAGIDRAALEATDDTAETIVAVMGNTVIPDAHKLESQFKRSNEQKHTVGMQNFMKRVAATADKRSHSVQDLMRFMQRGDLPVAEDGCIVIYKVLRKRVLSGHPKFTYVDCHSKKVPQRVGTYVHMDENMVDMNRRNECSNGLHVARRAYIRGFSGDVVTICKVRPEDVIAVPEHDANKMRVCGYHILSELPESDYALLKANKPIASAEGLQLLAEALAGQHSAADTEVKITGNMGSSVVVTKRLAPTPKAAKQVEAMPDVAPTVLETEDPAHVAEKVNIRAVSAEVSEVVATGKGRAEQAQKYLDLWKSAKGQDKLSWAKTLHDFKRSKKVGWDKLGITAAQAQAIEKNAAK
jgi:hypothetical protein